MIRLTAYVLGRVQRAGYRAKIVSLAKEMGLEGFVQNRPDGQVLVIAEGERNDLENFASALWVKNAIIDVENVSVQYSQGSGQYSDFKKITGPDEIGERLDDGIEVLKELVMGLNNLTVITKNGFESLNMKMDTMLDKQDLMLDKQDQMLDKQDQMLGKQDQTISVLSGIDKKMDKALIKQDQLLEGQAQATEVIRDLKSKDERFARMEKDIRTIKSKLGIR